ncbi:hypothetical protein RGAI101_2878 [Roseobacter sp. GAI101]|nr:hypothetical protein RGAI101_2878 [Roseobacter sp. GAI101]
MPIFRPCGASSIHDDVRGKRFAAMGTKMTGQMADIRGFHG